MDNDKRAALKWALVDFVTVFVVSIAWNYIRKNGVSVFDELGIAAVTAVFVYFTKVG